MTDETHALTAESMPLVRKSMKVFGQTAFAFAWLSAFYMTLVAMLHRTEGQPWYVIFALVALGIGADFWVGAGPVILRSSATWGIKGWVVVGWMTLAMALVFSYSNKVAYWVQLTDQSAQTSIAEKVDTLTTQRALVAANPKVRLPGAVKAERDGVAQAIIAKQAEIDGLPAEWPNRLRRAQREKQDLELQRAKLDGEYQTAFAVADAQAKIDAAKTKDAVIAARPDDDVDPVVQFIMDAGKMLGVTITAASALVWLHAFYSFFHEAAQFTFLGLATLRIPIHKMEQEHAFLISQRQLRAKKRVEMRHAETDEMKHIRTADAHFKAHKVGIVEIATARANLDIAKQLREVELERRAFEAGIEAQDKDYEREPLAEERGLPKPDLKKRTKKPLVPFSQRMFDNETGEELEAVRYPTHRKKRKVGDRTMMQVEREEVPASAIKDDAGFITANDPRAVQLAANAEDERDELVVALAPENDDERMDTDAVNGSDDTEQRSHNSVDELAASGQASDSASFPDQTGQVDERDADPVDDGADERSAIAVVHGDGADHVSEVLAASDAPDDSPLAVATPHPEIDGRPADEPVVLSDERYDELEARGVIVDGEFVSQEDQDIIEQDDRAVMYPALPAPVREVA